MKNLIRLFLGITPLIAVCLVVFELFVTNELVSFGEKIQHIDQQIELINEENMNLTSQVASSSSLLTIEAKALELGFTKSATTLSLGLQEVALNGSR